MYRIFVIVLVLMTISAYSVHLIDSQPMSVQTGPAEPASPTHANNNTRTLTIKAERGHYFTDARVDGRRVAFVVDTGATLIALRESDAASLGYRPRESDYTARISTANGEGRAARIQLTRVEIGDISVRDVAAFVVPDKALDVNLLGMSFLSRIRWTQDHGQLVLEQ